MKVFISCDMEGACGIVNVDQTSYGNKDYDIARRWLTAEVNAAAVGAFEAGAGEVLVTDGHGDQRNLLLDQMDTRIRTISGHMKPLVQVQGCEAGFDAAFLIAYHAKMGTIDGVLDHTMWGRVVSEIRINNRVFGETGLSALVLGCFGTPVVLVTGDRATVREACSFLGNIETVEVKKGIGRYGAESIHPLKAQELIKSAAQKAIGRLKEFKPFRVKGSLKLNIKFINAAMADAVAILPRAKRLSGLELEYRPKNPVELYHVIHIMYTLAGTGVTR